MFESLLSLGPIVARAVETVISVLIVVVLYAAIIAVVYGFPGWLLL